MKKTLIALPLLGFIALSSHVSALEIPLGRGGSGGGSTVGYVDMEAVFQEYPETQKAKEEYYRELADKRAVLADREKELADLKEQLSILRATLKEMQAGMAQAAAAASTETVTENSEETSTDTAAGEPPAKSLAMDLGISSGSITAVNETLVQREKALAEKETGLEEARRQAVQSLKEFEERRSLQIFGKLYSALVQLAEEQGISLVVDKNSILYGQNAMDLTEKLRRRVRGLPDDAAK
ncbi:MAG TPA: OmpH family outer membrane protein [Elusimicrobiota bacterium]|nr:OmpH family outer membrane protein [Elusimicrobiota bacterium]